MQNCYQSENWKDTWFVIADIHSDPLILDSRNGKILFSRHDMSNFTSVEIANNFDEFLNSLKIYVFEYYIVFNEKILDETYEVKNEFVKALRNKLQKVLNPTQISNFIYTLTY
jgi:hypothetical protein